MEIAIALGIVAVMAIVALSVHGLLASVESIALEREMERRRQELEAQRDRLLHG